MNKLKGIGAGIARSLVAEGAKQGGKAVAVQGDVSKAQDVQRLFAETKRAFGKLDVLVNNAGIYLFAALGEITGSSSTGWKRDQHRFGLKPPAQAA